MDWDALLAWYRTHKRDLPWRDVDDPWAVLVSEVMLQQTTVETVLRRYGTFLARYPAPDALAAASEEDLLKAWEGLGYYRRARNLHRAAGALADLDRVPDAVEDLEALPGVGPYTARAVAALAFGARVLPVDANVDRVLSRVLGVDDPSPARRRRRLEGAVAVPAPSGDAVQALFDLGSSVCTPRRPACGRCPLADGCAARASGDPAAIPPRPVTRPREEVHLSAALVTRGDRVLLVRPDGDLLGGLWALPHVEAATRDDAASALRNLVDVSDAPLTSYIHLFTHKAWHVEVHAATLNGACIRGKWHRLDALPAMGTAWRRGLDAGVSLLKP